MEKTPSSGSTDSRSRLITFSAAAERASNSPAWWRKLASRHQIAVVKLGRSARLREGDVERIIRDGLRETGAA